MVQKCGVREVSQKHLLLCSGLLKLISIAMKMHTVIKENQSMTELYKDAQKDQSRGVTQKKHGHRSRST
jgi:predicted nucleic-acid-binding Zn-ribbon protein